jgi:hypothetical protein
MIYDEQAISNTDTNTLQPCMNKNTKNSGQFDTDGNKEYSGQHKTSNNFKIFNYKNNKFKNDYKNDRYNLNRMPNVPPYNAKFISQAYNFSSTGSTHFFLPIEFHQQNNNIHLPIYHNFYNTNDINTNYGYLNHRSYVKTKKAQVS